MKLSEAKDLIGELCVIVSDTTLFPFNLRGQYCIILEPSPWQMETVRVLTSEGVECFHADRLAWVKT